MSCLFRENHNLCPNCGKNNALIYCLNCECILVLSNVKFISILEKNDETK